MYLWQVHNYSDDQSCQIHNFVAPVSVCTRVMMVVCFDVCTSGSFRILDVFGAGEFVEGTLAVGFDSAWSDAGITCSVGVHAG